MMPRNLFYPVMGKVFEREVLKFLDLHQKGEPKI
jgi:hypothetical protein